MTEIYCQKCSHRGLASRVLSRGLVTVGVCAECGYENHTTDESELTPDTTDALNAEKRSRASSEVLLEAVEIQDSDETHPDPGRTQIDSTGNLASTRKCRKCGHFMGPGFAPARLETQDCAYCGLDQARVAKYPPGQAPWERAPAGKGRAFDDAQALWRAFEEGQTDGRRKRLYAFVRLVRDEELFDLGTRRLRHWLIEHPEDSVARAQLKKITDGLHASAIIDQVNLTDDDMIYHHPRYDFYSQRTRRNLVLLGAMGGVLLIVAAYKFLEWLFNWF